MPSGALRRLRLAKLLEEAGEPVAQRDGSREAEHLPWLAHVAHSGRTEVTGPS